MRLIFQPSFFRGYVKLPGAGYILLQQPGTCLVLEFLVHQKGPGLSGEQWKKGPKRFVG